MAEQPNPIPSSRPSLLQNWISAFGLIVSAASFFAVICLLAMDLFAHNSNPYLGILTYVVAPAFLVTGLLLISVGALWERRRRRRLAPGEIPAHPQIDFNLPHHRRVFIIVSVVTAVFLMLTAFGSYQTYHFTESVQFCGQVCHTVMKPEFTAHQNGAHARVSCAECHIGSGAGWFVKSKLSGSYQVYAALANKYPTPIPTPVHNLRPAQDTCEQCHWPQKFYGEAVRDNVHYMADASNTVWNIKLLMKIGGSNPAHGTADGIHWHVSPDHHIEYIASDEKRQTIPWVRVTHADGQVVTFESADEKLPANKLASATPRRMDCIDCHNRPAHSYASPSWAVDLALRAGRINPALPNIKKIAVEALTAEYASTAAAQTGIAAKVPAAAVAEVQKIYRENFFPEMKVTWRQYPNNIGHTIFPGCYRCHDGKHKSTATGKVISHDCNTCHALIAQGSGPQGRQITATGLEFQHPVDIGDLWKEMNCAECHNGGITK